MARRSFKPSKNFEMVVSEAALGPVGSRGPMEANVRRSAGRSRVTLQDIANEIVSHAKEIVDSEVGLPSITEGGGRNIGYEFRSEDRKGKTYRASFRTDIRRDGNRMVIYVINDHEHAQDVEYGTGGRNNKVGPSSQTKHGYFSLPITEVAYAKIRRRMKKDRKPRDEGERILHNIMQRGRYYRDRELRAKKEETFDKRATSKSKIVRQRKADRIRQRTNKAKEKEALAQYGFLITRNMGDRFQPKAFVGRHRTTNKPILFSRSFRTYDGYAILQRAVQNIARNRF